MPLRLSRFIFNLFELNLVSLELEPLSMLQLSSPHAGDWFQYFSCPFCEMSLCVSPWHSIESAHTRTSFTYFISLMHESLLTQQILDWAPTIYKTLEMLQGMMRCVRQGPALEEFILLCSLLILLFSVVLLLLISIVGGETKSLVLVSCQSSVLPYFWWLYHGCPNKIPLSRWPETTEIFSLLVL